MNEHFKDHQFIVAGVSSLDEKIYTDLLGKMPVRVLLNQSHDILYHADAALVTSGTATLETALIGVPEVVCYKGNPLSFEIAKLIVNIKFISLVNLVMERLVVTELIQGNLNEQNLTDALDKLLYDEEVQNQIGADYKLLRLRLGEKGASARAATIIAEFLETE
jgi:lipid-A-disaccharide synthase